MFLDRVKVLAPDQIVNATSVSSLNVVLDCYVFFTLPFYWLDCGVAHITTFLADEVKLLAQVVAVNGRVRGGH